MQIKEHIEDKGILFWIWPIVIPIVAVFYLYLWIGAQFWDLMDYLP